MQNIRLLNIKAADNFEFGYILGKRLSVLIKKRVDWYLEYIPKNKIDEVKQGIEKFIPSIVQCYPHILEEIMGMSEGAKINILDLMLSVFDEETIFLADRPHLPRCTTFGAHLDNGDVVIGHNEDWLPTVRRDGMAIVKAEIGNLKFISLFYIGSLPGTSCGLNSYGIGFSGNAIDGKRFKFGIPKSVQLRAILDTTNLKDAKYIDTFKSSINSNLLLASKEHGILDSEDLWEIDRVFKDRRFLVHTNHPIEKKYQNENNTNEESIGRYDYLMNEFSKSNVLDEDVIKSFLKTHKPVEICGHISEYYTIVTVASAYINVTKGFIDIAPSTPCNHKYKRYYL